MRGVLGATLKPRKQRISRVVWSELAASPFAQCLDRICEGDVMTVYEVNLLALTIRIFLQRHQMMNLRRTMQRLENMCYSL